MTSSNRLMLCCLVLLIVHGATVFRSGAVMAEQPEAGSSPCASMVFTASDFPALAGGIEVRTPGDAVAQVWSPASQEWRLSQHGDTINLRSSETGGNPLPRWQKLGKVVLRAGHPLKVTVSGTKKPETDQAKDTDKAKAKPDLRGSGRHEDEGRTGRRSGPAGPEHRLAGRPRARARPRPRTR